MTRRRLLTSLIVLACALALVQAAIWWLRPPPTPIAVTGPPRSGYTLSNFTYYGYDDLGKLNVRITSPSLQRKESDRSLFIDQPRFLLPPAENEPDAAPWLGHSEYGWVSADNTIVKLMGKVDMHRAASAVAPSAEIHTSDVTAWPGEHRLATDDPARIRQGTSRMSGIGLRAKLDSKYMELLHDFHGTFKPAATE